MNTYHLIKRPCGRVILQLEPPKSDEWLFRTIDADSWLDARSEVFDCEFDHVPGWGHYAEGEGPMVPERGIRETSDYRRMLAVFGYREAA